MRRLSTIIFVLSIWGIYNASAQSWPAVTAETKPGARWWWLGSAVNEKDLKWNMEEYSKTGLGALEITPLYGVKGNDANNLQFLSMPWMIILKYVV